MSSSARLSPHRRRSHSSSSPLPSSRHLSSDKWRTACKRPRASTTRSSSYKDFVSDLPADKWDIDKWRRGKKARRDSSSPIPSTRGPCLFGSSPVFREQWSFVPPSSNLPSTSDAFQLFPSRPRQTRSHSSHTPMSHSVSDAPFHSSAAHSSAEDVTRLRSNAFGELQRSIEESGEGLVSRMRDWEREHANVYPCVFSMSSKPSSGAAYSATSSPRSPVDPAEDRFDDEDDIQIVSGDTCSDSASELLSMNADSDAEMDLDQPTDFHPQGTRYSSPGTSLCSGIPGYASEDEAPALSFSTTNSARSSPISLSPIQTHVASPAVPSRASFSSGYSSHTSPSDKAIAALALVMANGAGGLNDYEAVRTSEGDSSALDDSLVGEMWH